MPLAASFSLHPPLWLALVVGAVLVFVAWNVAVSAARRLLKEMLIAGSVAVVVVLLLGAFGFGPLYRPPAPAPRGGCGAHHFACLFGPPRGPRS